MTYLRLTSSLAPQNFVLSPYSLIGYCHDGVSNALTIYTPSYAVNLNKDNWDNWDEFVEQLKERFLESNDDF